MCGGTSQRAYGTGQDRMQQMDTQKGAEKDEEMIKQFWSEPVHDPNTPKKLIDSQTITSWILLYKS